MLYALPWLICAAPLAQGVTERVSVDSTGLEANGNSEAPALSDDGQLIAFQSAASNLVTADLNQRRDIFLRDFGASTTELISQATDGSPSNGDSMNAGISGDGRYVVFASQADGFSANDINGTWDVFVRDRQAGTTKRISQSSAGIVGNDYSWTPDISQDGRFVAFESFSSNLVKGDLNDLADIFVVEIATGAIERVSLASFGFEATGRSSFPSISGDGRYVAFASDAPNLVANDTNGRRDVFVYDRLSDTVERVSESSAGQQGNNHSSRPSISADGRFVAFESVASDLVGGDSNFKSDVFVHDRNSGQTRRVSVNSAGDQVDDYNVFPVISAEGRHIAFQGPSFDFASDTVNGFLDVLIHDQQTGTTERVSSNDFGIEANGWNGTPGLNADGRYVGFFSYAVNLIGSDTNDVADVYRRDRGEEGDTFTLSGPASALAGNPVTLNFQDAPGNDDFEIVYSFSNSGSLFRGHPIELGAPAKVTGTGQVPNLGDGSWTSPPTPLALAGRVVYLEMLVTNRVSGRISDSNSIAISFQ